MTVGLTNFDTLLAGSPADAQERKRIAIKIVVVTMFEIGEDTGDRPGEFQAGELPLPEKLPFPQGYRDLRYSPEKGVLGIVTGIGTARAAASIILNPAVGWALRCVTWDGQPGIAFQAGLRSNGRFELPAVQIMSQCFAEDAIPPPSASNCSALCRSRAMKPAIRR
jgi:hypothetical protein